MKIIYQGSPGAYSHLAAELIFPNYEYVPSKTFEECFKLCYENDNYKTIIPVENSIAGRVADIQYLINKYKLQIHHDHSYDQSDILFAPILSQQGDYKLNSCAVRIDKNSILMFRW